MKQGVNCTKECVEPHLIISASIRKSISSCSEQISGRVCGVERTGEVVWAKTSLELISRPLRSRQAHVALAQLFSFYPVQRSVCSVTEQISCFHSHQSFCAVMILNLNLVPAAPFKQAGTGEKMVCHDQVWRDILERLSRSQAQMGRGSPPCKMWILDITTTATTQLLPLKFFCFCYQHFTQRLNFLQIRVVCT